jgi:hypothetical protein
MDIPDFLRNDYKVYVTVLELRREDGTILPRAITWEDGMTYEIDRVMDIRPAASLKAGGAGIRYTIRIGNTRTYLWLEDNRYFVERRRPRAA